VSSSWWIGGPVGSGRHAKRPAEGCCERPDASQPDRETDVGDATVGAAQQRGGALHPAGQEVLVRRLPERPAELSAEMSRREARGACQCGNVERFAIAGVDEVLRAEKVAGWMGGHHLPERSVAIPATDGLRMRWRTSASSIRSPFSKYSTPRPRRRRSIPGPEQSTLLSLATLASFPPSRWSSHT
jgi:hypothetical protein